YRSDATVRPGDDGETGMNLVAGQFICVPNRSMKSSFLSSDYRCSQGVLIDHVVREAVVNQRAQQEGEDDMEPTVLFENEKVRVIQHVVRPGERNELQERNDRVQYFFTSCFIRYNHLDGRVEEIKHEGGKSISVRLTTCGEKTSGKRKMNTWPSS